MKKATLIVFVCLACTASLVHSEPKPSYNNFRSVFRTPEKKNYDDLEILERSSFHSEDSDKRSKEVYTVQNAPKASANAEIQVSFSGDTNTLTQAPAPAGPNLNEALKKLLYMFLSSVVPVLEAQKANPKPVAYVTPESVNVQQISTTEETQPREVEIDVDEEVSADEAPDMDAPQGIQVMVEQVDETGERHELPVDVAVGGNKNETEVAKELAEGVIVVEVGENNEGTTAQSVQKEVQEEIVPGNNVVVEVSEVNGDAEQKLVPEIVPAEEVVIDLTDISAQIAQQAQATLEETPKTEITNAPANNEELVIDLRDISKLQEQQQQQQIYTPEIIITKDETQNYPRPENRPLDLKFYDYLRGLRNLVPAREPAPVEPSVNNVVLFVVTPEEQQQQPQPQPQQTVCRYCNSAPCYCTHEPEPVCTACNQPQCICNTVSRVYPPMVYSPAVCPTCNYINCACNSPWGTSMCASCASTPCICPNQIVAPVCGTCGGAPCVCYNQMASVCNACGFAPCACPNQMVAAPTFCGSCGGAPCVCANPVCGTCGNSGEFGNCICESSRPSYCDACRRLGNYNRGDRGCSCAPPQQQQQQAYYYVRRRVAPTVEGWGFGYGAARRQYDVSDYIGSVFGVLPRMRQVTPRRRFARRTGPFGVQYGFQ